ncbi:hypothetical protein, partial [Sphaerimonospora thailandensis]|uniref:hypothetical protein n=1 Tax=Sphaerimonospora thailandensis TaxID=795644 RepID=UPI0019506E09
MIRHSRCPHRGGRRLCWYALHGKHDRDLAAHQNARPWYTSKTTISIADAHAALRRALITAKYRRG